MLPTTQGAPRSVGRVARARLRVRTTVYRAANLNAQQLRGAFDPFLGVDHFQMRVPMFAPHPHAGFCALTYVLDESEGALVSRDSQGHAIVLRGGDLCWTTAGRGIVHEEVPEEPGQVVHGLQIFVNLPARLKRVSPSVHHLEAARVPVVRCEGGARVRVVVGSFEHAASPLAAAVPITLLDVTLPPDACFEHTSAADENAMAYVLRGNGGFGAENRFVRRADAASFAHDGDRIQVRAGSHGMRIIVFAGRPLHEPIVARGPFIMSAEEEIEAAFEDYRSGRMGRLEPSF
jgi:redox-sensitive bicupin YhaK (pirin superfamily)